MDSPPALARTAFVTGSTGFVGSFLVDRLLADGCDVVALARGPEAAGRVVAALARVRGATRDPRPGEGRLEVLTGDVRDPALGLAPAVAGELAGRVEAIWHCAANFGGGTAGETPWSVNVDGLRQVLALASRCQAVRPIALHHVSTAFAADLVSGVAREVPPGPDGASRNAYEASKREAERLVLRWPRAPGSRVAILRPSIILGHSVTGRASGFAAYYDFLRSLCAYARRSRARAGGAGADRATLRVRSRPELRVNLVTIDFLVDAMVALAAAPRAAVGIYHLVHEQPVPLRDVIAGMCESIGLEGLAFASGADFTAQPMTPAERRFHGMIAFERPYLEQEVPFDNRAFRELVPTETLPAPAITPQLLQRINRAYLAHSGRQALETRSAQRLAAAIPAVVS